jgi:formylmethanofuran dehydrogenase subunit B
MTAWIDGKETADTAAVAAIAKLLGASRNPLILVDAIDLAGAAAAIDLARASAAILDHAEPTNVRLMQQQGWLTTTPGEAGLRADAVLWVAPLPASLANDEACRKLAANRPGRSHYYVGPASGAPDIPGLTVIDSGNAPVFETIGLLRALIAGRKIPSPPDAVRVLAEMLKSAKYGIAAFASGGLDDLTGVSIAGLVEDLSATTRWSALPLGMPAGQGELIRMALALTRLPPPLSFAKSVAAHDAWLYGSANVLQRGEADAVLWIASSERPLPDSLARATRVAVASAHRQPLRGISLQIETGIAGVDHAAIIEPSELGAFTSLTPAKQSTRTPVASVLRAITHELSPQEARA